MVSFSSYEVIYAEHYFYVYTVHIDYLMLISIPTNAHMSICYYTNKH
jgi:hypothetical protein